jgi:hypothetical protein
MRVRVRDKGKFVVGVRANVRGGRRKTTRQRQAGHFVCGKGMFSLRTVELEQRLQGVRTLWCHH